MNIKKQEESEMEKDTSVCPGVFSRPTHLIFFKYIRISVG